MERSAYRPTTMTTEEMAEHDRVFGALAQRTRELVDAIIHTRVDHDIVEEVADSVEALTARLDKDRDPRPLGIQITQDGRPRDPGNAAVGVRNPVAPPLHVETYDDGRAVATFHLGGAYEGPPGLVHGGVSALVLDQVLGMAAAAGGSPGMTGRLELSYRRPTPLGDLGAEAWIEETSGVKTIVQGHITGPDGLPTVEARGVFILPRWARGAAGTAKPPAFE